MAHLVENMCYVGEVPWHGLGKPISNDLSTEEVLHEAGANYEVLKCPEYALIEDEYYPNGKYSLVRSDTNAILSSVSEDWHPVQNREGFEFFREWVDEGEMHLHTAGVLDEGRMVFVMAKVNEGFSLFKGKDVVESNLLFSIPHQYGKSTIVMGTNIRVVCNNTLQLALSAGKSDMMVRLNHRREFDAEMVKKALNLNRSKMEVYKQAAEFLSKVKTNAADTKAYFDTLFPVTSNKKNKEEAQSRNSKLLMDILETQPGAELGAGTWWQNFNAVTYATDHLLGNSDETRLYSAFYGVGRNRKVDALKLATEMAKAA
jgi:phage/plasmid-like protein (TIGR03299 family)